jgi:RNA-directed DNA polymerase
MCYAQRSTPDHAPTRPNRPTLRIIQRYAYGGVASPLLFNIALHGMETAAGATYRWDPYRESYAAVTGTPVLVRYADDFVALCDSREQAEQVTAWLTPWLADRGLAFNQDKTRIVDLDEGFDFLSCNIRRYRGKLLIKPSKAAVQRIKKRLADEVKALRGANAAAVIRTLNPIVRGWAAYYRGVVATETFQKLDRHMWTLLWKWALFRHRNKPKRWVANRYFGQFHPTRQDRWVFGNRDSGAYLHHFAWTNRKSLSERGRLQQSPGSTARVTVISVSSPTCSDC